jgi:uncharacterized protein (DUF2384 family)
MPHTKKLLGTYVIKHSKPDRKQVDALRASLRHASLVERVELEREGISSDLVKNLIGTLGLTSSDFQGVVGIPKATYTKKMRDKSFFTGNSGHSVVGLLELINMVEDMITADGQNQAARDFDVQRWVGHWIQQPQPALGGRAPAELMDTPSGRASVKKVLGAIQSGAYQ